MNRPGVLASRLKWKEINFGLFHELPRRPGDSARLVASSEKIKHELGWQPVHDDLEEIVSSAWQWHKTHPDGYGEE